MTLYDYTYSITGSFPNAKMAPDRLEQEIRASTITVALDHIDTISDDCIVWFKALLTTGSNSEKETLDGIVAAHSGEPLTDQTFVTASNGAPVVALHVRQPDEVPLVTIAGRLGSETIYATHNFCDETTWYNESVRITSASLAKTGSVWYCPSVGIDVPWIDMFHGKILDEESLIEDQKIFASAYGGDPHGYSLCVVVNGVEKTQREPFATTGGDYIVNYTSGTITPISEDWTGLDVTASFSHRGASNWYLEPLPGKVLTIEKAEVQFSSNIVFNNSFVLAIEGAAAIFAPQLIQSNGGPLPDTARIELASTTYKTIDQLVDEAVGAYPQIPAMGGTARGFTSTRNIFQFHYSTVKKLYSSLGMRLSIYTNEHKPFGGERGTATFYCMSNDDPGMEAALVETGFV